jgi:hypothetical protein
MSQQKKQTKQTKLNFPTISQQQQPSASANSPSQQQPSASANSPSQQQPSTSANSPSQQQPSTSANSPSQQQPKKNLAKKAKTDSEPQNKFNAKWLSEPEFQCKEFSLAYFHVVQNDGVICSVCQMCPPISSRQQDRVFSSEPSYPTRKDNLRVHLASANHKNAMATMRLQRSSTIHSQHLDRQQHLEQTIAQRIKTVYWIVMQEIANRKLEPLQQLLDDVGNNDRLRDFKHISGTSCNEFINFISDFLSDRTTAAIREHKFWSTMVDESTDVSMFSQYITFVRFVDNVGRVQVKFLDIRRLGSAGGTAANLLATFKKVAEEYELDTNNHVAIACDGAAAMLGRNNGMAKQLQDEVVSMISVHCHAHRLALAAGDVMDVPQLKTIKTAERLLIQMWKFFACSAVRTAKLAELQAIHETKQRTLQRTCRTRWLSCEAAVTAGLSEIVAVWDCLAHFANEKDDAVAVGILSKIKSKDFLIALHVLNAALPHLSALSKLFQQGDLNFAQIEPALIVCKSQLVALDTDETPWANMSRDWARFSEELGPLNDRDRQQISSLTKRYIGQTLLNIDDRFPEPEILGAFKIFDPAEVGSMHDFIAFRQVTTTKVRV